MRLLATQLAFVQPGALLAAIDDRVDWPQNVFRLYWPLASSASFQPLAGGSPKPDAAMPDLARHPTPVTT